MQSPCAGIFSELIHPNSSAARSSIPFCYALVMGHTSTLTLLVCLSLVQPYLSFDVNTIKLPKQFLDQFIEQKAQSYTLDDLERATDFISTAWDTGHNEYDLRALPDETDKNTIKPPLVKINIQKNGLFDHLYADGEAINRYTSKREVLDTNSMRFIAFGGMLSMH